MKIVYKYKISIFDDTLIWLPKGAEVLHADTQDDDIYIWALINPENKSEGRTFTVYGTGHEIHENVKYITTFFHGRYVWHVFEVLG